MKQTRVFNFTVKTLLGILILSGVYFLITPKTVSAYTVTPVAGAGGFVITEGSQQGSSPSYVSPGGTMTFQFVNNDGYGYSLVTGCGATYKGYNGYWDTEPIYSDCTISGTFVSGVITASDCTIAEGASSCNTNLVWNVTNPWGTSSVVTSTNITVATGNSSGGTPYPIALGANLFYLNMTAISGYLELNSQVTVYARCTYGTSWSNGACRVDPTASCSATSVAYGGNPGITFSSTNANLCYIYNNWANLGIFNSGTGTYYPGPQTSVGANQAEVLCYNPARSASSGWNYCSYTVDPPPINGDWSAWSAINPACGYSGTQTRSCTNPTPAYGGADCSGLDGGNSTLAYTNAACTCSAPTTQNVNVACDVNGYGYGATSGQVTRSQTKSAYPDCTFPTPANSSNSTYVSDNCVYPTLVNCAGSWNNNATCSLSCGGGVYQQTYTISQNAANGGTACPYANGATQWGGTSCNTQPCPPSTPTNFSASPSSCNNNWLNLSWSPSSGATSYQVYRNGSLIYNNSSTNFSDTGLSLGTNYSYTLTASNSGGTSGSTGTSGTVTIACVIPVNGSCSATHYNCSAGTAGSQTDNATTWDWWCNGSGGGSNSQCSENKTVSVSANTPYTKNSSASISFIYSPSTNVPSTATACRLLDNAYSALTTYQSSSPIVTTVPSGVGTYAYYVQCRNSTYTAVTATSNQVMVNVTSVPTLTSPTSSSILTTSATLGTTITANGGSAITSRGTCYGTTPTPTTNCLAEGGTAVSAFTQPRTGLTPYTTYYYRGYAVSSVGTGYSADGTFTTTSLSSTINISSNQTATWCINPGNVCGSGTSGSYTVNPNGGQSYTIIGGDLSPNYTGPTYYNDVTNSPNPFSLFGNDTANVTLSYSPAFSFSLTNTPPLAVIKGVSDTYGQAIVTVTKTGGVNQVVNLAVTGAPAGISAQPASCSSYPCNSTILLTISSGTAAGPYTITVTGTSAGVASQQTGFTLQVNAPSNIIATCTASPNPALVGQTVNWQIQNILGGNGSYISSYTWDGLGIPNRPVNTANSTLNVVYSTAGAKVVTALITDTIGNTGSCTTSVPLKVNVKPNFKEQ